MIFVYVLKSLQNKWFYIGQTENLEKRLAEHNAGFTRSTKANAPFELIYYKPFNTRLEARDYEKYLKIRSNKEKLLKGLKYIN